MSEPTVDRDSAEHSNGEQLDKDRIEEGQQSGQSAGKTNGTQRSRSTDDLGVNNVDNTQRSTDIDVVEVEKSLVPDITVLSESLARVPGQTEEETLVVNVEGDKSESTSVSESDRQTLWDKVLKAAAEGDKSTADFFLRVYAALPAESQRQSKPLLKPPTLVNRSTSADAVLLTEPIKGGTILFINGTVPSHNETGFTPYFDKAIRTLCGIIPLTIFDKEWQAEAIGAHIKKQSKTDEKNGEYTGFSYPNEWSQSFAKWTSNYRNFLVTIRDVYDHKDFAVWIVKHKENVDNIIAVDGFLTGFCYDIQVRQNAFAFRKKRDGVELMTDISVLRTTIRDEAWSLTRKLDELDFTDNPYVRGGSKPEWDPRTGKPKIPKNLRWNSDGIFDRDGQKGGGRFRNQEGGQGGSDYGGWSGSQKRKGNWGGSNSNDN
ncbi:hypothetical protein MJO29_001216 [Puccinia striiformis f. sp. tritici]|nr:hypothetical protein MJO29_001216 [Puccinia striiformis f. sp. tritici]